jgi:hypothetical protein
VLSGLIEFRRCLQFEAITMLMLTTEVARRTTNVRNKTCFRQYAPSWLRFVVWQLLPCRKPPNDKPLVDLNDSGHTTKAACTL